MAASRRPRVALVGAGGYGRVHLRHLLDFHAASQLTLAAAVVLPADDDGTVRPALAEIGCEVFDCFADLQSALPRLRLSLGVVPTPIHLHARMAIPLLRAGMNVLVEKPIAATLRDAAEISRAARESGRVVAVGFQYLHAPEVQALKRQLLAGALGPLRRIVVHAAWPRSHAYYARNDWAGRLSLGGDLVLDSPVNNAMSHFLLLMFFLAGASEEGAAVPVRLRAELYRAQPIESFDTAIVRLETAAGCRLDFYGTHSTRGIERPALRIVGENGTAEWVQDSHAALAAGAIRWRQAADPESETRRRMWQDVLARCRGAEAFICDPELAAAHVRCVEALHREGAITSVPVSACAERTEDGQRFTFVPGLDEWLAAAAREGTGLREAGVPWAVPPAEQELGGA